MAIVHVNPKDAENYLGSAAGLGMQCERYRVAFDGGAGSGAAGTVALFTVTGDIIMRMVCTCEESLTVSNGATIEIGYAANTAVFIAQTVASTIAATEIWHDATSDASHELTSVMAEFILAGGEDIFATIGVANVTGGVLVFDLFWTPLTSDAAVASAA